ncbi:MAG: peptide chain release factor N(5)-glutamine methyltransferase [Burkholderiaceae bacterium]
MTIATGPASVDEALAAARSAGVDRLDAQLLLAQLLAKPRTWLLAHGEVTLAPAQGDAFRSLLARRTGGEPLAYLLGHKEFHGLDLRVDARVLVPRPETELLVDWATELLVDNMARAQPRHAVDLGTGSGAIALALKHAHPRAQVLATDASAAALAVADSNAQRLGLDIEFRQGSWWAAVGAETFDLAVSNPPYIAGGDSHLAALRHEPLEALSPGADGLAALSLLVAGALRHLRAGAWLLLEHGHDQASAVRSLFAQHGFEAALTRADLAGHDRCTGARQRGRSPRVR